MHVGPGTVFYERGREASAIYNIVSGTVCSFRRLDDSTERVAAFLFADDLFGLARAGRYVNSTRAVTPVSAFRMPLEALSGLLLRDASLQFRFLCKTAQVLRETQRRALLLTRHDPVERVAMFLGLMEDAQGEKRPDDHVIALPMNRRDIASFLNLTAGSVDAALGSAGAAGHHRPAGRWVGDGAGSGAVRGGRPRGLTRQAISHRPFRPRDRFDAARSISKPPAPAREQLGLERMPESIDRPSRRRATCRHAG